MTPAATFRPNLVSHVTLTKTPFRLTYHIRAEAKWNDGAPVTASDFEFTDRVRKAQLPPEDLRRDHVRSVRALDAKTVRVALRMRYPDWRYLFDIVLPRHALAGEDFGGLWKDEIVNPKTGSAIGSGPFLFGGWERGAQLTFVRNPRYWGSHPAYLDRLVYRFLRAQDIADALRGGEIDMIDPAVAALGATVLELHRQRAPGIRFPSGYGAGYENIAIRQGPGGHRALRGKQGKLVRQALAYGIDRVAIARTIGTPLEDAPPLEPQDSVAFLTSSPNYRPNWKSYRYRPAHARRLLEQAGCRRGQERVYSCNGERLELRFAAPTGVEARQRTVEVAQRQLQQVGVEIRPVFAPPSILFGQILPSGDFDLMVFGWGLGASTAGPLEILGCQQPQNFSGYCDRLVTRDLDRAHAHSRRRPPRRTPEQGRREASQGRTSPPALPVGRPDRSQGDRSAASSRTAWVPSPGTRRTRGSRSSPRHGDRRLAARGLGSGRRACADAEARRHARLSRGRPPVRLSQCLAHELRPGRPGLGREGPAGAFRGRSRLHVRGKPRLEGQLHEEATIHVDLSHPSGGAVERRSPDHGPGLHLHAPGDTPSRYSGAARTPRPRPQCACR